MMTIIKDQTFDKERELYGVHDTFIKHCTFDGPADGESALKECRNVRVEDSFFDLRYSLWHDRDLVLARCELTENCRAALWYDEDKTWKGVHAQADALDELINAFNDATGVLKAL